MKLFYRLFLILFAFSLLPVGGVAIYILSSQQTVKENAAFLHGWLAQLTADSVERTVDQLNRAMSVVEDIQSAHGNKALELHAIQHAAAMDSAIELISIVGPDGMESMRMADPEIFTNPANVDRSKDATRNESLKSGRIAVGEPLLLGGSNRLILPAAHPLNDGRVLYLNYSLQGLKRRLQALATSGERGRLLLFDQRSRPIDGLGGRPPAKDWVLPPPTHDLGWWDDLPSPDGPWVVATAPIRSLGWRAASLQPRASAYAESDSAASRAVGFFIALCLLVGVGAYALSSRLVSPLNFLVGGAQRVAAGDFSRPIPSLDWAELNELAKVFNTMTEKIRHYQEIQVEKVFEEKAKVDALIRNIPEGVVLVSLDGTVAFANAAAVKALHLKGGTPSLANLPLPLRTAFETARAPGARRDRPTLLDVPGAAPDQILSFSCDAIKIAREGRDIGILLLLRDITAERQLEAMKEEFFHAVVHDLRGPISVIDGMVHSLKNLKSLGERERRYLDLTKTASSRLSGLISNILDVAKLESGTMKLNLSKFTAESLLIPVRDINRVPAEGKAISVEVAVAANAGEVVGDAKLLDRVLMNLVGNALKFTPQGGRIILGALDAGADIEFYVQDTGAGIPANQLAAVFEKFKQLDRDAAKRAGYGLGLSICKKIVDVHSGRIWVESEEGKGSRFIFRVPRVQAGAPPAPPSAVSSRVG